MGWSEALVRTVVAKVEVVVRRGREGQDGCVEGGGVLPPVRPVEGSSEGARWSLLQALERSIC